MSFSPATLLQGFLRNPEAGPSASIQGLLTSFTSEVHSLLRFSSYQAGGSSRSAPLQVPPSSAHMAAKWRETLSVSQSSSKFSFFLAYVRIVKMVRRCWVKKKSMNHTYTKMWHGNHAESPEDAPQTYELIIAAQNEISSGKNLIIYFTSLYSALLLLTTGETLAPSSHPIMQSARSQLGLSPTI